MIYIFCIEYRVWYHNSRISFTEGFLHCLPVSWCSVLAIEMYLCDTMHYNVCATLYYILQYYQSSHSLQSVCENKLLLLLPEYVLLFTIIYWYNIIRIKSAVFARRRQWREYEIGRRESLSLQQCRERGWTGEHKNYQDNYPGVWGERERELT